MDQQSNVVVGTPKVRLRAPVILARLKAERTEQPLSAAKVLEAMSGLPAWGLSPKGITLMRAFHFPSEEEAHAYTDFLFHMGSGLKLKRLRVARDGSRVYVYLRGRKGGIPPYLLDFAALLSQ